VVNEVGTINTARRMNGVATAIARDKRFFFANRIAFVSAQAFNTDG
jgi:hypothetical protein